MAMNPWYRRGGQLMTQTGPTQNPSGPGVGSYGSRGYSRRNSDAGLNQERENLGQQISSIGQSIGQTRQRSENTIRNNNIQNEFLQQYRARRSDYLPFKGQDFGSMTEMFFNDPRTQEFMNQRGITTPDYVSWEGPIDARDWLQEQRPPEGGSWPQFPVYPNDMIMNAFLNRYTGGI